MHTKCSLVIWDINFFTTFALIKNWSNYLRVKVYYSAVLCPSFVTKLFKVQLWFNFNLLRDKQYDLNIIWVYIMDWNRIWNNPWLYNNMLLQYLLIIRQITITDIIISKNVGLIHLQDNRIWKYKIKIQHENTRQLRNGYAI